MPGFVPSPSASPLHQPLHLFLPKSSISRLCSVTPWLCSASLPPPAAMHRWLGEPVRAAFLHTSVSGSSPLVGGPYSPHPISVTIPPLTARCTFTLPFLVHLHYVFHYLLRCAFAHASLIITPVSLSFCVQWVHQLGQPCTRG